MTWWSRARVALVVAATIAVVAVWIGFAGSAGDDREERIVEAYRQQLGLTKAEAEIVRQEALDTADYYCSIEPDEVLDVLQPNIAGSMDDAIFLAEAACPERAQEFAERYAEWQAAHR